MASWSAERIKVLRKQYGESQSTFCKRLGVAVTSLQFWEQDRGPVGIPFEIILERLEEDLENGMIREIPDLSRRPVAS